MLGYSQPKFLASPITIHNPSQLCRAVFSVFVRYARFCEVLSDEQKAWAELTHHQGSIDDIEDVALVFALFLCLYDPLQGKLELLVVRNTPVFVYVGQTC